MEQKSMTALVSAFARAYHQINNQERIFDDSVAKLILSDQEYNQIADSMAQGINFFNPSFEGTAAEALRWIVDNQLSPSPLGRGIFTEKALENSMNLGTEQYLIFAAGYDTFGYRQPKWGEKLQIFEIDRPEIIQDKQRRLQTAGIKIPSNVHFVASDLTKDDWENDLLRMTAFDQKKISFCSLLGITYYLSKAAFGTILNKLKLLVPKDSAIAFDYPDENTFTDKAGARTKKQLALASGANEKMLAGYSYSELETLLSDNGFFISEHLLPNEITKKYFENYNKANPSNIITAFDNVNYCLAIKK